MMDFVMFIIIFPVTVIPMIMLCNMIGGGFD